MVIIQERIYWLVQYFLFGSSTVHAFRHKLWTWISWYVQITRASVGHNFFWKERDRLYIVILMFEMLHWKIMESFKTIWKLLMIHYLGKIRVRVFLVFTHVMRRPCWCTKQCQNVAQVLHNNRIKFPKDFFLPLFCTQTWPLWRHVKTENRFCFMPSEWLSHRNFNFFFLL